MFPVLSIGDPAGVGDKASVSGSIDRRSRQAARRGRRGFRAVVDGHDSAHEFMEAGVLEPKLLHEVTGAALAGIELKRLGYVAVGVGIAMQDETEP